MAATGQQGRQRPDPAALRPLWGGAALHDTHVHLDAAQYEDAAAVVARAAAAGVSRLTAIGIDRASSERALAFARTFPGVTAAIGFHPNMIGHWTDRRAAEDDLNWLASQLGQPGVVAVGEIGLDYYWDKTSPELQAWACEAQLRLAADAGLPVVIHNREADADIVALLARGPRTGGVMHCFSGDLDMANRCVELGFHIGMGGPVTYSNPRHAVTVARAVPLERLLLETDAPYLAPVPYRGKTNEPAYTVFVAAKIAEVRELPPERLASATTANAAALFRLPPLTDASAAAE